MNQKNTAARKPAKGHMQPFLVHSPWGSCLAQIGKFSLYFCAYRFSSNSRTLLPSFCHLSHLGFPLACFSGSSWHLFFSGSSGRRPYEAEVNRNTEIYREGLLIWAKVNCPWVYPLVSFLSKENLLDFRFLIVQWVNLKETWQRGLERIILCERNICELNCLKNFYFCLHLNFTQN